MLDFGPDENGARLIMCGQSFRNYYLYKGIGGGKFDGFTEKFNFEDALR